MGKTIAQELFTIAEAQGGTAEGYPRTIAGAVDALTDALAGSDVDSGRTIAEAVAVMGEYIGGGGGGSASIRLVGMNGDEPTLYDGKVYDYESNELTGTQETYMGITVLRFDGLKYGQPLTLSKGDPIVGSDPNGDEVMYSNSMSGLFFVPNFGVDEPSLIIAALS